MRFIETKNRPAAKDVASRSYAIDITVHDLNCVLIERLSRTIERYLRNGAEHVIIATNNTDSTKFDCACVIRYPEVVNKRKLQENLRSRHILPCFGEPGALGNRAVHVDAKPIEDLENSAFQRLHVLRSHPPWTLIYEGPGAAAGRAASGLHISLVGIPNPSYSHFSLLSP